MAQESVGSAGENGCQALTVIREASVAYGINALVETMQATSVNGSVDRAPRVTKWPGELPNRDHPMLALCEFRQFPVCSKCLLRPFVPHSGSNDRGAPSLPPPSLLFVPRPRSERKKAAGPETGGFRRTYTPGKT